MKKTILRLFIATLLMMVCGQTQAQQYNSRRLLSISQSDGSSTRKGTLEYDEQGRIVKYTHVRGSRTTEYDYTYNADGIIVSSGSDSYTYTIQNGRVSTAHWSLDKDYVNEDFTYTYNEAGQMVTIVDETTYTSKDPSVKTTEMAWAGGNLASMDYYRQNGNSDRELRTHTDYTYGTLTSEPMLRAIFGFGLGDKIYIDELFETFAIYPYMGKLPENLFAINTETTIYNGNRTYTYNYNYEQDSDGNIVTVTINDDTYTLEWDATAVTPPISNTFTIGDLTYTKLDDGTVSVAAATTAISGEVRIPSMVRDDGQMYRVTTIADNGFANCTSMTAITIPASITDVGAGAFSGCVNLMEVYCLGNEPANLYGAFARGYTQSLATTQFQGVDLDRCVLHVPFVALERYRQAPGWQEFSHIEGVHGDDDPPVTVTAVNYSREYGEANPLLEFTIEGGILDGEPELTCEAGPSADTGSYTITLSPGTVKNHNVTYQEGSLTVVPAPLKVTVADAEREQGQDNPEFVLSYEGWKLNDDESVLTKVPVVTSLDADGHAVDKDTPAGDYVITVSEGEARNYELIYQNGTLTITEPSAISSVMAAGRPVDVYSLEGVLLLRGVTSLKGLQPGVYLVRSDEGGLQGKNGKKVAVM